MYFEFSGRGAYAVLGSGAARICMVGLIFLFQNLDIYDIGLSIQKFQSLGRNSSQL